MPSFVDSEFILIVDDNPTNLSVLSEMLGSAGFRFRVATNGENALVQVERKLPSLILLDVQMPGIDGFETCRRLKENPKTESIPVIFTTALVDTESKAKAFALGAVDYIPKPFNQSEVLARLKVHLQLKRLTDSLEFRVHERTAALEKAQVQLVQQEKLSSLGEMVAGIAHEINNPINFISSNLQPLQEYIAGIADILQRYQKEHLNPSLELQNAMEELELEFVLEDLVKIIDSLKLGSERIRAISHSLRSFVRADSETQVYTDLHEGLNNTLMILHHRLKDKGDRPAIQVVKSYGSLPQILCYPEQINQVFMNLLANAIDAIEEELHCHSVRKNPLIHIETYVNEKEVIVKIGDNGAGINDVARTRLFEPLFTTKPAGRGTGLGLAIARQIIEEKHNGTLTFDSQVGKGSTFTVALPSNEVGSA